MKRKEYTTSELRRLRAVATDAQRDALDAYALTGTVRAAAAHLGVSHTAIVKALRRLEAHAELKPAQEKPRVEVAEPKPPEDPVALRRAKESEKKAKAESANLVSQLADLQDRVALFDDLSGRPLPPVERHEFTSGLREACAVALFSDWHVETLVRPQDTPANNAFTLQIADLRIKRAFAGLKWLTQSAQENFSVRSLCLWIGGDMITNHLHPENVETAQLGPTGALFWVQERLIAGIQDLLDSGLYDDIRIPCSYGNHGRTTDRMRATTSASHSWEWVMYQAIAFHFRNDVRVSVLADESAHQYLTIYDFDAHFHHGHDIKFGGGVGGITIPINKAVSRWNRVRFCKLHNFGHFHQYTSINGVNTNGSLIGYDGYAMTFGAEPEPPRQSFYLVDSKRGQTMSSPIWAGDESAEREIWAATSHQYRR